MGNLEAISGIAVLERTFDGLSERFEGVDFSIPKVHSETVHFTEGGNLMLRVADDSDYHRTRRGSMIYSRFKKMKFGERERVLAYGDKTSGYPAYEYKGDLMVIGNPQEWGNLETEEGKKKFLDDAARGTFFLKSLFGVYSGGKLFCEDGHEWIKNPYSRDVREILRGVGEFVAEELERDPTFPSLATLSLVITQGMTYKPEIVPYLVEKTGELLSK